MPSFGRMCVVLIVSHYSFRHPLSWVSLIFGLDLAFKVWKLNDHICSSTALKWYFFRFLDDLDLIFKVKGHLSHSNWFRLFTINSLRVLKFCVKIIEFQGAITLSRIIGHAIQKRRIISLFRSYYTLIFMHVLQAVFEIDW